VPVQHISVASTVDQMALYQPYRYEDQAAKQSKLLRLLVSPLNAVELHVVWTVQSRKLFIKHELS